MSRLPFDPSKMSGAPTGPAPRTGQDARPLTVTALASLIDSALRLHLPPRLSVVGEITGFSARTHWYFRLADDAAPERAQAVLDCVMFASAARRVGFSPRDGQRVVLTGRVEFYPKQGRTQFYAEKMEPVGAGDLDQRLKALLAEIRALGWLDPARKRPLPTFPRRIAVLTSRSGAALQDVLVTMRARCPAVDALIVDVRVQGQDAAQQIARALRRLSDSHQSLGIDAILVTRGGGSAEDLWAFNDRTLAQAIVESRVPVVAAIGHETDVTVAELVADERCATPTQAAMRLTPDRAALTEQIDQTGQRLRAALRRRLEQAHLRVRGLARSRSFTDPRSMISLRAERLESRSRQLDAAGHGRISATSIRIERLGIRLLRHRPEALRAASSARLFELARRLHRAARARLSFLDPSILDRRLTDAWRMAAAARHVRLDSLERELIVTSPQNVLARGYSVTTTADGRAVRSADEIQPGQTLTTRVARGAFRSTVTGANLTDRAPPLHRPARTPPPRTTSLTALPKARRHAGRGTDPEQMDLFKPGE